MGYASQSLGLIKTWVPTWTGFSVDPVLSVSEYIIIGKLVVCWLTTSVSGTSNATTLTFTLPTISAKAVVGTARGSNNGSTLADPVMLLSTAGSNICNAYLTFGATIAWTNVNGKQINFQFEYRMP